MRLAYIASAAVSLAVMPQISAAEIIKKLSPHPVSVTIDRLQAAVETAGATVFARVDHAKGAASINTELRPTEMLMFGNPALGTPPMLDAQTAGLDLPLRVLAFEDAAGQVHLVYHSPDTLATNHGLPAKADYLTKMAGAVDKLTNAAIAAE